MLIEMYIAMLKGISLGLNRCPFDDWNSGYWYQWESEMEARVSMFGLSAPCHALMTSNSQSRCHYLHMAEGIRKMGFLIPPSYGTVKWLLLKKITNDYANDE